MHGYYLIHITTGRQMFVRTMETPNPDVLTFLPGKRLMKEGVVTCRSSDSKHMHPMASSILEVEGVDSVMFGGDFLSVTKLPDYDWESLKTSVFMAISDFFADNEFDEGQICEEDSALFVDDRKEDSDIIDKIKELLDERVRPAVAMDGGDIAYKGYRDGVVYVKMRGACAGCPASSITLQGKVKSLLAYYIPEVEKIITVDEN